MHADWHGAGPVFFAIVSFFSLLNLFGGYTKAVNFIRPRIVTENNPFGYGLILNEVRSICKGLRIRAPKVGVFNSGKISAYAIGYNRFTNTLCISNQAIESLTKKELRALIGHELSHIVNSDMGLGSLLNGLKVGSTIFSVILMFNVNNGYSTGIDWVIGILCVAGVYLSLSLAINRLSRQNELIADLLGAKVAGPERMISVLTLISKRTQEIEYDEDVAAAAFVKSPGLAFSELKILFSTHPSTSFRIKELKKLIPKPVATISPVSQTTPPETNESSEDFSFSSSMSQSEEMVYDFKTMAFSFKAQPTQKEVKQLRRPRSA